MPNILVCSYLESEHLARIRDVDPSVEVTFLPDLIASPRYVSDHTGAPWTRSPEQAERWASAMAAADVLFDFDYADPQSLLRHGRDVRWVQASSAGIGTFVEQHGLNGAPAVFTTAAGIHARPLAEFVLFGMLAFANDYPRARRQQREGRWERFVGGEIEGATLAIVGLGSIGVEVARLARRAGVRTIGSKRTVGGVRADDLCVDELYRFDSLHEMLPEADYLCLAAPHTPETDGLMDREAFAAMKNGSVLINIGRGGLVREEALMWALDEGPLKGAVLDVAPVEPLPAGHPLWSRDDVIIFPHSASTSVKENERLTRLFCENLDAFLGDRPLANVYDHARRY